MASSLIVGAVTLVLACTLGYLGARFALAVADLPPFELTLESVFVETFVLIAATVVAAFGGIIGFALGVAVVPPLLISLLGWRRPLATGLTILALEIATAPVFVAIVVWLDLEGAGEFLLLSAVVVLGGVLPAVGATLAWTERDTA